MGSVLHYLLGSALGEHYKMGIVSAPGGQYKMGSALGGHY